MAACRVLLLILVCLAQYAVMQLQCPPSCQCGQQQDKVLIACNTTYPGDTLRRVHPSTTHLLLNIMEESRYGSYLNFSALEDLELLVLSAEGLRSPEVYIDQTSFSNNRKLRILETDVKLNLETSTFAPLSSLEVLSIANTMRNWTFAKEMIFDSLRDKYKLRKLSLRRFDVLKTDYIHQMMLNMCDIFLPLKDVPLVHLDLRQNDFRQVCPCISLEINTPRTFSFQNQPNSCFRGLFESLQRLDLSQNDLTYPYVLETSNNGDLFLDWMAMIIFIPKLKSFDIGEQGYVTEVKSYKDYDYFSKFVTQDAKPPYVKNVPTKPNIFYNINCTDFFWGLDHIEVVSINHNKIFPGGLQFSLYEQTTICASTRNSLRYVSISHNLQWNMKMIKYLRFFGLHKLEYVNLQYNGLEELHKEALIDMPSLRTLLLGGNSFGYGITAEIQSLYLDSNFQLEVLDLSDNSITDLPHGWLKDNVNLRQLNLSSNSIKDLTINLSAQVHLELLNLTVNQISHLNYEFRKQLDDIALRSNLSVDLQENPLTCGCPYLDFVVWVQQTSVHLVNKHHFMCDHPFYGLALMDHVDVKDLRAMCFPSATKTIVLATLLSTTLIILVVLVFIMYCKRWRLRYWLYLARLGWKKQKETYDLTSYQYDVFVAYNWQDGHWVHGPLLKELERKRHLKLCIHQRDFIPGEIIEEVIVDKIKNSRKTLLVLSPHFVKSNWCHFELQMARNRLFEEGNDVLILAIVKPIGHVNGTLSNLLNSKVYLKWTEDQEGQELFWRQLSDVISSDHRPYE